MVQKDAVIILGATNNTYTATENGVYHSVVTATECSSDESNSINIDDVYLEEMQGDLSFECLSTRPKV